MQKHKLYSFLLFVLVCLACAGILIFSLKDKSPTTDEMVHLPAGYAYDRIHDYRFNPEHPALAKSIFAVPLLQLNLNLPANFDFYFNNAVFGKDNWQIDRSFGEDFLYFSNNSPELIFYWGRVIAVILTLLLLASVYFASRAFFGEWPALIPTVFVGLSPIVLGHGNLTNTDIAISLGFILATWTLWNYITHSNRKNLILFSIAFAIMALFKYTFIIFFAIYVGLKLYSVFILRKKQRLVAFNLQNILIFVGIFAFVLLVAYGLKPDQVKYYFKGLAMVVAHTSSGHTTYFLGQLSDKGWWYYFPVAFCLKNTIPTLILVFLSIVNFIFNFRKPSSIWFVAGILYLLVAMYSKANLGVRHILPAIAMLTIYSASVFAKDGFLKSKKISLPLILVLILWQFCVIYLNYPYYISYFNPLIKKELKAYYMTDSNLDWGQDGKYIADYIREKKIENIYLDYAWTPARQFELYGLNGYLSASDQKEGQKGNYFISASALEVHKADKYAWLQNYPKKYLFGGTVVLIEVDH